MTMSKTDPIVDRGDPANAWLHQLREIVASAGDRAVKARRAAEVIRNAGGFHWVGLYDVTPTEIVAIAWTGEKAPHFPRFPVSQGLSGAAVRSRVPVVVQDVTTDPRYLTTFGSTRSEAIVPITHDVDGSVVGTLDVESEQPNAFTKAHQALLTRCAKALQPLFLIDRPPTPPQGRTEPQRQTHESKVSLDLAWYERFFEGLALEMWQKAIPPELTVAESDFLERTLELRRGALVLDVPCGAGRHSLDLAQRGYRMTGVDLSPQWIAEARRRAGDLRLSIEWRQADMRDLPWEGHFDAAFCFGNSFGYLEPPGNRAFLHAVSRALKPGAHFAMHTGALAESVLPNLRDREEARFDDLVFVEENSYHAWESCVETRYSIIRGGVTDSRTGLQWIFTHRELREMLQAAGLTVTETYGSLEGEPYRRGASQAIVLARRT
jgi:putative methionine-R-sulfoxide reductase with GAF domain/SAM-dependent methyltransferase